MTENKLNRKLTIISKQVIAHGNYPIPLTGLYYCDWLEEYHDGKVKSNGDKCTIQQDCCYAIVTNDLSEEEIKEIIAAQPKPFPITKNERR